MATFEIKLGDETLTLAPSTKAMRDVNKTFGGLLPALQQLQKADVDAAAVIVAIGSGRTKPEQVDALVNSIFLTGVTKCLGPIVQFTDSLLNSGESAGAPTAAEGAANG